MNLSQETKVAEEFNEWQGKGRAEAMQNEHIIAVQGALKEMKLCNNIKILDMGCGNGYATRLMAEKITPNGEAYGIDLSENMIKSATELSKNFNNTHFKVSNFSSMPFEDNFFDIILSVESIYYCDDMFKTVKEVKRTLKTGGKFYCITYFFKEHHNSEIWADYVPLKMHYLSENEYKQLFYDSGLTEVYTKRIFDPRPVDKENFKPKWGYNSVEELINFKENIGALLVVGTNAS